MASIVQLRERSDELFRRLLEVQAGVPEAPRTKRGFAAGKPEAEAFSWFDPEDAAAASALAFRLAALAGSSDDREEGLEGGARSRRGADRTVRSGGDSTGVAALRHAQPRGPPAREAADGRGGTRSSSALPGRGRLASGGLDRRGVAGARLLARGRAGQRAPPALARGLPVHRAAAAELRRVGCRAHDAADIVGDPRGARARARTGPTSSRTPHRAAARRALRRGDAQGDAFGELPRELYRKLFTLNDRQGELFFYMHEQMLARYDAELLSHDLARVEPFDPTRGTTRSPPGTTRSSIQGFGRREQRRAVCPPPTATPACRRLERDRGGAGRRAC